MVIGIDASKVAREDKTGTENYSWNLIKALAMVDRKNRYVLYFNDLPPFFEIGQPNFSTKILKAPRLWTQGRLAFECLIKAPDILFVPAHTIPIIRRPTLKTVVTVHDLGAEFLKGYYQFPQKFYLNWSTNYVAANASHIIAVSNSTKKDLVKKFKLPNKKVSVVYEGIDKKFFAHREASEIQKVREKYGLTRNYFFYVGTIQPRKNLENLIQALSKLKLKNLDLVLAGSPGWLFDEIYKAPKYFGVSENVHFLGFVPNEDLPGLYSGALALTYPSIHEGFGLPILEAFAADCPVLTSKGGATGEVAADAAVLVDPANTDEIAAGLKKILTVREEFIGKGRKRLENFSWEKTARETIEVFEKMLKM